jgi:hypothetical protein
MVLLLDVARFKYPAYWFASSCFVLVLSCLCFVLLFPSSFSSPARVLTFACSLVAVVVAVVVVVVVCCCVYRVPVPLLWKAICGIDPFTGKRSHSLPLSLPPPFPSHLPPSSFFYQRSFFPVFRSFCPSLRLFLVQVAVVVII